MTQFSLTQIFNRVFDQEAIRVIDGADFAPPANYDNFTLDQTSLTDVFKFYDGVTLLRTITLTYTDASKETLASGAVT